MNGDFPVVIGRLAVSRAGRDRGRCFVIVAVADEDSVWIADGDLRKSSKPKRKKLMHLRLQQDVVSGFAEKAEDALPLQDNELRDVISAWQQRRQKKVEEAKN